MSNRTVTRWPRDSRKRVSGTPRVDQAARRASLLLAVRASVCLPGYRKPTRCPGPSHERRSHCLRLPRLRPSPQAMTPQGQWDRAHKPSRGQRIPTSRLQRRVHARRQAVPQTADDHRLTIVLAVRFQSLRTSLQGYRPPRRNSHQPVHELRPYLAITGEKSTQAWFFQLDRQDPRGPPADLVGQLTPPCLTTQKQGSRAT